MSIGEMGGAPVGNSGASIAASAMIRENSQRSCDATRADGKRKPGPRTIRSVLPPRCFMSSVLTDPSQTDPDPQPESNKEADDDCTFAQLGLCPELLEAVESAGFEKPTPIQAAAIPKILEGRDVVGIAQTGTGKTAAFGLPSMHRLGARGGPRGLVLSPTRELAIQTQMCFEQFGKGMGFRSALIIGGASFRDQQKQLGESPDIVVGTPGRVLDQIERRHLSSKELELLVLDEADRLLDMGFAPQINAILEQLPRDRQTLLFSATMPPAIEKLTTDYLRDPETVTVGPRHQAVDRCTQELYITTPHEKLLLLQYLLREDEGQVLVFTRTRRGADEVYRWIRRAGHQVAVLHADRRQEERIRALSGFRDGNVRVLVATDIASRGLDVEGISRVINYDVPPTSEDYLHRIGRTARASREGHASTFASMEDLGALRSIEAGIGAEIPTVVIPRSELNAIAREEAAREHERSDSRSGSGRSSGRNSKPRRPREDRGPEKDAADRDSSEKGSSSSNRDSSDKSSSSEPSRARRSRQRRRRSSRSRA